MAPGSFLLAFLCLGYLLILIWFYRGLRVARRSSLSTDESQDQPPPSSPAELPTVSIVVCARNEEACLPELLAALSRQNYPKHKLEICLVDDRSSDRTGKMMATFAAENPNVQHLRINDTVPGFAPKKRAIDLAIRTARGEVILLTDADATPGPQWAVEMARQFHPGVVMVCGYSPYFPRQTLLQKMLALEYFSVAAVSAGSIGCGRPLTCTGSNFAYLRSAYFAIGGFHGIAHFVSGDDDLFLQKMHEHHIGKIRYAAHSAVQVPVRPPSSWRDFKAQRTRYASKGRHYKLSITLSLIAVYLLNLLLSLGLLSLFFGKTEVFLIAIGCGLMKALSECFYLRSAAGWFGESRLLKYFPLVAVLHPFYIAYFSTRAQFARFDWRGEEFSAKAAESPRSIS